MILNRLNPNRIASAIETQTQSEGSTFWLGLNPNRIASAIETVRAFPLLAFPLRLNPNRIASASEMRPTSLVIAEAVTQSDCDNWTPKKVFVKVASTYNSYLLTLAGD